MRASVFDFTTPDLPGARLQRRLFEAYVMAECVWTALGWAGYIEHVETIVHPLGIAHHVPLDFMLDGRVPWVNAALIALLIALGFARLARWAYAGALVLMLFQYGARYSIGEIPHGANLIGMCLLGFGLAPLLFGDRWKGDRFVLGFIYLAVATGYMSAATCKLVASGIRWPLGEHLSLWIFNKAIDSFAKTGHFELNVLQQFLVDRRWAGTLFLCMGVATELSSGLIIFPRLRAYALWAVVGLHIGIWLVLEIWFRSATIALALLALPPSLFEWLGQRRTHSRQSRAEMPVAMPRAARP
jgi:hypothetical protein